MNINIALTEDQARNVGGHLAKGLLGGEHGGGENVDEMIKAVVNPGVRAVFCLIFQKGADLVKNLLPEKPSMLDKKNYDLDKATHPGLCICHIWPKAAALVL